MFNYYLLTIREVGTAQSWRKNETVCLSVGLKIKKLEDLSYFLLWLLKKQKDHLRSSWKWERMPQFLPPNFTLGLGPFLLWQGKRWWRGLCSPWWCPRLAQGSLWKWLCYRASGLSDAWPWGGGTVGGARGMLISILIARQGAFHFLPCSRSHPRKWT